MLTGMRISAIMCAGILSATAAFPAWASAQPTAPSRPKIGLVLGGGGALGIAHVGVLKVLEELRIPVDYVTGTSMGSIVGGLYASGLSPDQIGDTLAAIDWGAALKDRPSREELAFRRKQDTDRYLLGIEIGIGRDGLRFRRGAAAGQKLNYLLQTLTATTVTAENFDGLNIPFRCLGTDIRTGEAVILSNGNLADAIRASMAVPGAFTPVEIGGRLLVDGGLVKNMPVDVVRDMGAEIVIAVDVVGSEAAEVKVETGADLLARSYTILKRPMEEAQLKNADYVVVPQLQGLTSGDFHRTTEFVPRGEAAARAMAGRLGALSLSEADYRAFLARQRRAPGAAAGIEIREVRIEGNRRVDEREIRAAIESRAGSTATRSSVLRDLTGLVNPLALGAESAPEGAPPHDVATVLQDINRVFGMGDFEQVTYTLQPQGEAYDLVYKVVEKPWGPNYLHFGLQLATDLEEESTFSFLVNLTATRLNALGAEWRNNAILSDRWSLTSEFYQPVAFSNRVFVAPRLLARNDVVDFYQPDSDRVYAEYRARTFGGALDVGTQFGSYGELRLGVERGWIETEVLSGSLDLPEDTKSVGKWTASLTFDRLDQFAFPLRGYYLNILGSQGREYLGGEVDSESLSGIYRQPFAFGRHLFNVVLRGGTALGSNLPVYDQFTLGGLDSFGGLGQGQLRGPYMAAARLGYLYRIKDFSPASGKGVYAGILADAGNTWLDSGDMDTGDLRYGGTAVLAVDSMVGPIFIGFGVADGGYMQAYLSLGSRL
jgi:NTE family protein